MIIGWLQQPKRTLAVDFILAPDDPGACPRCGARHGAMPRRTFTTAKALTTAREAAFEQVNAQLKPSE